MARRYLRGLNGERYCGDRRTGELHDLDNELGTCGIDEVLAAGAAEPFRSRDEARAAGYSELHWCFVEVHAAKGQDRAPWRRDLAADGAASSPCGP